MTRTEMVEMLRQRLHEPPAWDRWSEAQAISAMNTGYQLVQLAYQRVNRHSALRIDTTPLVANQALYPLPIGCLAPLQVYILDASGVYRPIVVAPFQTVDQALAGSSETQYCLIGRYLQLGPVPPATLAAGLKLSYIPAMTLAAATSVPMIPLPLHLACVMSAHLLLIGETAEGADQIIKERSEIYSGVFDTIDVTVDKEVPFSVGISKNYGS